REQLLPLLAKANNHGDLGVKLSALKQAKDILLSVEPGLVSDFFPFLADLHSSPEPIVRKHLVEIIDDIGARTREHICTLLPVLFTLLRDHNPLIAKQSIMTGSKIFSAVLVELVIQFQRRGIVERWLEELWAWMLKFRNAVLDVFFEAGPIGPKLIAVKFIETFVLHFTSDSNDFSLHNTEGGMFNISWVADGHPVLDRPSFVSDANRFLGILLDMLPSASNCPGSLLITTLNSLATIARRRPLYYKSIFASLLDFRPSIERTRACHSISVHYALRNVFLGFLKCTHPVIVESRDRLLRELRAMNAGDAADQAIRQVEKMIKNNGRVLRDPQLNKVFSIEKLLHGDASRKRLLLDCENQNNSFESMSKRTRYGPPDVAHAAVDAVQDHINGMTPEPYILDGDLSPVEQMIAMIGALIAEGERGAESLEILISNMHPDLLADIVITNMKHLPKSPPGLLRYSNSSLNRPSESSTDSGQFASPNGNGSTTLNHLAHAPVSSMTASFPSSDAPMGNISSDLKRDPRRDPRRLDPRRVAVPTDVLMASAGETNANLINNPSVRSDLDSTSFASPALNPPLSDNAPEFRMPNVRMESNTSESSVLVEEQLVAKEESKDFEASEISRETNIGLHGPSSLAAKNEDLPMQEPVNIPILDEAYSPPSHETEQLHPDTSTMETSEVVSPDLPGSLPYIKLTEENQGRASLMALERIIQSYRSEHRTDYKQTQIPLIARLFAQSHVNDALGMVQKSIISDYEQQKGHELVLHILYCLHSPRMSDSGSSAANDVYERFFLEVAKSLLHKLPASDKSFSRLLGEVPTIPGSVLGLLHDVCTKSLSGTDARDGDRVTQGLGAVWSLILGRPLNRHAFLDIALKCAVHHKDEVRTKAIRLVSNKLYSVDYLSQEIEKYATDMFLSTMGTSISGQLQSAPAESAQGIGGKVECTEASTSGSHVSEHGISSDVPTASVDAKNSSVPGASVDDSSSVSSQAHVVMSLFFALCAKKPILLHLVFDKYGPALQSVKQAVSRHISVLVRSLGSSCTELLNIISDPPQGSEDLVIQVLHVLSEGTTPSPDLLETIKRLYETRLKDATVLIPILSAFSRDEVLPIFPQLIQLPLPKFQTALAHILQGSAHSGPALTPVEVLVAIHDISPEKEGIPLKKITDACTACFEQHTVFTQQVLTKALNQMVDQTTLPLLFMRTVIQAIDAFPTMVDVVMDILSKLVSRQQIWKMPKLWVGFLKCVSQTLPHSFRVLLQLPSPQLESALNKYPNLRSPLAAHATQSSVRPSVNRSTLAVLGLASPS
ncbi:hypothetical protein M569_01716, partial [Genlisea aurea]